MIKGGTIDFPQTSPRPKRLARSATGTVLAHDSNAKTDRTDRGTDKDKDQRA